MEGLQRVEVRFRLAEFPFVEGAADVAGREIENRKSVLFERREACLQLQAHGRKRRRSAGRGRPSVARGADGAGEHADDGIPFQVVRAVAQDPGFGEGVEVAREEEGDTLHGAGGGEQAVMLRAPTGLPKVFGFGGTEFAIVAEDVGIPIAPFAGAPADGKGGQVHDVVRFLGLHAGQEPGLGFGRDEAREGPSQRQVAAAIVEYDFGEFAPAQSAVAFRDAGRPIGGPPA